MVAKQVRIMKGLNWIGSSRIKIAALTNGFSKIIVMAVATTRVAVKRGIQGKAWARAAPVARLLKIAGKIVPPRQPKAKPKLVTTVFTIARVIKNRGLIANEWWANGTMLNSPEKRTAGLKRAPRPNKRPPPIALSRGHLEIGRAHV